MSDDTLTMTTLDSERLRLARHEQMQRDERRRQREDRDGYYGRWSQATPAPTQEPPCTP